MHYHKAKSSNCQDLKKIEKRCQKVIVNWKYSFGIRLRFRDRLDLAKQSFENTAFLLIWSLIYK